MNKWCFAVINLMLLDYFKQFHLMERVTLSSSNSEICLKCIFMPFHQWNSVFSCEFWWWWLWFEWERKAAFPRSFKTFQAGTYLGFALPYLCLCCKSTTGKQLRENKTEVKVVLKQCKYRIWGVSKQDDSKLSDVIFFLPLLWNEISAEKDLTPQSASLPTNLISLTESGSIPAFSSQTCNLRFPGPDLFLCSTCFLVIETSPKLWERNQNSSGYFKGWKSL